MHTLHHLAATNYAAFCDASHYSADMDRETLPALTDIMPGPFVWPGAGEMQSVAFPNLCWPATTRHQVLQADVHHAGRMASNAERDFLELVAEWQDATGADRARLAKAGTRAGAKRRAAQATRLACWREFTASATASGSARVVAQVWEIAA